MAANRRSGFTCRRRLKTDPRAIDVLTRWASIYPLVSIEDGLAEDHWVHWPMLAGRLGDQVLVMGDDLLCTNPIRITRAVETNAGGGVGHRELLVC